MIKINLTSAQQVDLMGFLIGMKPHFCAIPAKNAQLESFHEEATVGLRLRVT